LARMVHGHGDVLIRDYPKDRGGLSPPFYKAAMALISIKASGCTNPFTSTNELVG
jgi:hypothetical protein